MILWFLKLFIFKILKTFYLFLGGGVGGERILSRCCAELETCAGFHLTILRSGTWTETKSLKLNPLCHPGAPKLFIFFITDCTTYLSSSWKSSMYILFIPTFDGQGIYIVNYLLFNHTLAYNRYNLWSVDCRLMILFGLFCPVTWYSAVMVNVWIHLKHFLLHSHLYYPERWKNIVKNIDTRSHCTRWNSAYTT